MRFRLINPYITGSLRTTAHAESEIHAAKKLYARMAQYFANNLPSFFFTLEDGNGKFHHFEVNERRSGEDVNYTIRGVSMTKKGEKRLHEIVTQKGGNKHKDDESSSSSSSKRSRRYSPFEEWLLLSQYYLISGVPVQRYFFPVFDIDLVPGIYPVIAV